MENIKDGFIFKNTKPNMLLLPLGGIGSFILFYIIAAMKYPGGSWVLLDQDGFSFWNNYLCDLLDVYAINGEINPARFYAIIALGFLCAGLFWLWFYLPRLFENKSTNQSIMRISGLLSLITIVFLALGNHDKVLYIAGFFAVIALITSSIELFKVGYKNLFLLGVFCLLVFLINYYIYETRLLIKSLPVIQKVTFILFISWFVCLDVALYRKLKLPIKKTA